MKVFLLEKKETITASHEADAEEFQVWVFALILKNKDSLYEFMEINSLTYESPYLKDMYGFPEYKVTEVKVIE